MFSKKIVSREDLRLLSVGRQLPSCEHAPSSYQGGIGIYYECRTLLSCELPNTQEVETSRFYQWNENALVLACGLENVYDKSNVVNIAMTICRGRARLFNVLTLSETLT
jgi:hypothetical protein